MDSVIIFDGTGIIKESKVPAQELICYRRHVATDAWCALLNGLAPECTLHLYRASASMIKEAAELGFARPTKNTGYRMHRVPAEQRPLPLISAQHILVAELEKVIAVHQGDYFTGSAYALRVFASRPSISAWFVRASLYAAVYWRLIERVKDKYRPTDIIMESLEDDIIDHKAQAAGY